MQEELDVETVKRRSVKGVVALTGRYFVLYIMALVAQIFLGVFLTPFEWGIFALVSAIVDFLVYFSDIGLAASLIQSKEEISRDDLKTTFTIQQGLVIFLLVLLLVFAVKIQNAFGLSSDGLLLLYVMGVSLFLSSLKTIPTVLLERDIQFHKIAFVNIIESGFYYVILVLSASQGLGIKSFVYAVGARSVVGLVVMYVISPWRPGVGISRHSLSRLLRFGIPYQANTLIALAKDRGITLVLGRILGLEALGILDWAQKWSQMPLRVVLDSVTKVTFPAFSRMQDKNAHLSRSLTRSIFFITLLAFPATFGLVILAPVVVRIVPQYEKWIPALIPLALISINSIFASFTTQLTNLFNAIGKIKITFYLMIMWTVLTWVLVPLLGLGYGVNGAALGFALVGTSSIVAVYLAKRYVDFSISDSIMKPFQASLVMAVVLFILRNVLPGTLTSLSILLVVGITVYGAVMVGMIGKSLVEDAKRSLKILFNRV